MAVMWPRKLPRSVLEDPRRKAEVRVFNKLSEVLENDFVVFYSSPWLGTDRLGNEKDGECDFLVAHPEHGVLAIEVKGGEIAYDPEEDQWRSRDGHGFVHRIKDPVAQARSAKHELLRRLAASPRWPNRHIHATHGVIFPAAGSPPRDLRADRPARLFCCARKLNTGLRAWVAQRMNEGRRPENCQHLGSDGIAALERLLAQPFTLNFRIGAALSDAGDTFRALEPTQYHILDSIADIPRALIRGGAGTGKTVVAIEEAIRSAAAGRRTLLTCHSRPLAANLERQLRDIKNLTVIGFHSLCGRMAKEGQVPVPSGVSERELYETVLPEILYHAMGAVPSARWDTVIVDEAQDFRTDWWLAIEACIKPDGRLRVFMDSNQVVYDEAGVTAQDLTAVPVRLSRNLRNTKPIHRAAAVHYMGPEIVPDGPDGLEVIWIEAENEPEKTSAAYKELRRLIFDEEVDPGDIAVLLNGPSGRLAFLEKCAGTSIPVTDAQDVTREEVVVDTVRRFKGLERPAVIVVVTGDEMPRPELAYVAFSRAKAFLAVVSSTGELALLRGQDASTDHRVSN